MPEALELTIVLATNNSGKLRELAALFEGIPVKLRSVRDVLGEKLDVEESGDTFEANALLKARAVCRATGKVALADDSGLEVKALGGRPGVHSARFSGEHATDAENNAALLTALRGVEERTAQFRAVLALVTPWDDKARFAEGTVSGSIALAARGSGGFGYDPLFILNDSEGAGAGRHMAELSQAEKNQVSHRARAATALRPQLLEVIGEHRKQGKRA